MRNFTNKLWNIGRFLIDFKGNAPSMKDKEIPNAKTEEDESHQMSLSSEEDKKILERLNQTIKTVTQALDQYRFHDGAEALYEYIWHEFADKYIESAKTRRDETQ